MNSLQEYELKKEFSALQELSYTKATTFRIIGNERAFTITDKFFIRNYLIGCSIFIIVPLIFLFLGLPFKVIAFVTVLFSILGAIAMFICILKYGPLYKIKVDVTNKFLEFESYFLVKYLRPSFKVAFKDINQLTAQPKSISIWNVPGRIYFNSIFVHYGKNKKEIFRLLGKPDDRIDHILLIKHLTEIMKISNSI